jgi:hypothetical protein
MPFGGQNVGQLTIFGRSQGQQILNVFHYRRVDPAAPPISDTDLPNVVFDIRENWRALIAATFHDSYSVESYTWRTLTGTIANPSPPPPSIFTEDFQFVQPGGLLDVGGVGGPALPTFDALGVQKLSNRAGRNFRGSARFGPHLEAQTDNNSWTPAFIGAAEPLISTLFVDIYTDGFGGTVEMAIFSRTLALAAPPPFTLLRDLTAKVIGAKLNGFVSSQVSRKASVGSPT